MKHHVVFLLLLLATRASRCAEAIPPSSTAALDSLARDLSEVKQVAASIQASLLASVRLLQDQLEQHARHDVVGMEERIGRLEKGMAAVAEDAAHVRERSAVWDTFQHHVVAWADLMNSVDGKIDHVAR